MDPSFDDIAASVNGLTLSESTNIGSEDESSHLALLTRTEQFRATTKTMTKVMRGHIQRSGGDVENLLEPLLSHFDANIEVIIKKVLIHYDDESVPSRIAAECYQQAAGPHGDLHIDHYFGVPYDFTYKSEQYYEYGERIRSYKGYAVALQQQKDRDELEARCQANKDWIDLWIRVLNTTPERPTLFSPPANYPYKNLILDVPKYLFRTFDAASEGINNASVIASRRSSRGDILSLESQEAAGMLYRHLKGIPSSHGEPDTNLVSWTSSFLFAIQRAIWRAHKGGFPLSDVTICAIDTNKFPPGQFMRDITLLNTYNAAAKKAGDPMQQFFQFRLDKEDYYNGEYLSQGRFRHASGSCMMSLQQLVEAGLYELYPEFNDAAGKHYWAKRALSLRQIWKGVQETTDREVELALEINRKCFGGFDPCDIGALILAFKYRRISVSKDKGESLRT
jgi:hypothetical protein